MTWLRSTHWVAALLLGCIVTAAAPAAAQPNRNAEARVYFEQGNRHLARAMRSRGARRQALLEQALDSYVESLAIVRSRNVVFNAGLTLQELGRYDEAHAYYTEYLGMPGLSAEERAEGTRRLTELAERVAVVAIESEPAGAEVRIDRRDLASRGTTPIEVALPPGEHSVFLTLDGYEDARATTTATTGERVLVRATLEPRPVPLLVRAPAGGGQLTIDGRPVQPGQEIQVLPGRHTIRFEPAIERVIEIEPGSDPQVIDLDMPETPRSRGSVAVLADTPVRVTVDGAVVGEGLEVRATLAAGRHMVEVRAEGYATTRSEVDVQPGEPIRLEVHMEPSTEGESSLGDLPILGWALTGVVAATAVALSVNAVVTKNDFEDAYEAGTPNADLFQETEDANLVADVFWIATAAVGLGAILMTLFDEPVEQRPSTIELGATPLPGGAMVRAELPWGMP